MAQKSDCNTITCPSCGQMISFSKGTKGYASCSVCGFRFATCKMVTERQLSWLVDELGYDEKLAKNLTREDASKLISHFEEGHNDLIPLSPLEMQSSIGQKSRRCLRRVLRLFGLILLLFFLCWLLYILLSN